MLCCGTAAAAPAERRDYDSAGNLTATTELPAEVAPTILTGPQPQLGQVGGSASFSVSAAGSPVLSFQWKKNNVDIPVASNPSAVTDTLILTSLVPGDFADYSVTVTNSVNFVTSGSAPLSEDSNADLLPDAWQVLHFGVDWETDPLAQAGADADGDENSNAEEYADGTDPNDDQSRYFRLTITSGNVTVSLAAARYAPNTPVTLTALAQGPQQFTRWDDPQAGATNPLLLTMTGDVVIGALYSNLPLEQPALIPSFTTSNNSNVRAMVRQADGKMLLGGSFDAMSGVARQNLARLHGDGSLDLDFAPDINGAVYTIVTQPDGKILIGGAFTQVQGMTRLFLARLEEDGALDPTFDPGTVFSGEVKVLAVREIALTYKILAGGSELRRLEEDGALDPGFEADFAFATIDSLLWQNDGGVIIGGFLDFPDPDPARQIARLLSTGAVDLDFTATADGSVRALRERSDGQVFAAGDFAEINGVPVPGLVLLDGETGALDNTFTPSGITDISSVGPGGMIQQTDGKLVVTGTIEYGSNSTTHLARFSATGVRETAFKNVETTGFESVVALDNAGDIVVGGPFTQANEKEHIHLARFSGGDGALDAGFTHSASSASTVNAMLVDPDGSTFVVGAFNVVNGQACQYLARLLPDGSLDADFNSGEGNGPSFTVATIIRQPDGKMLIAGNFTQYDDVSVSNVARINPDGSLDTSFAVPSGINNTVRRLALEPDGDVLILGAFTQVSNTARAGFARLSSTGVLDSGFNPVILFSSISSPPRAVAVQSDGGIVIGGNFNEVNGQPAPGLARLFEDGTLDTGFVPPVNNSPGIEVIHVLAEDSLLIGGGFGSFTLPSTEVFSTFGAARLLADGTLDPSFKSTQINGTVQAFAVEPGGSILAGGNFQSQTPDLFANFVRLLPSGAVDPDFLSANSPDQPVNDIRVYGSGKVGIGGEFAAAGSEPRLGYARYALSNTLLPGPLSIEFTGGVLTLDLYPISTGASVAAVDFEVSADGFSFSTLGQGQLVAPGHWTFVGALPPGGIYFRAVVTDANGVQAASEGYGPIGVPPVLNVPSRIYAINLLPFEYIVTSAGVPTEITATGLPGWAEIEPGTGFDPDSDSFYIVGVPPVPGFFRITLTAENDFGSDEKVVDLVIRNTFETWRQLYFDAGELANPALSGPDGDAVGDGVPNLVKYKLGYPGKFTAPPYISPIPFGVPTLGIVEDESFTYLALTYTYNVSTTDVDFLTWVTGDLEFWDSGPFVTTELSRVTNPDGSETVIVRDNEPIENWEARYMELEAVFTEE